MSQRPPVAAATSRPRALDALRAALLSPIGIGFVTALCLVAADLRRFAEVEPSYGFLRWNLFLAWVPLVLAYGIAWAARREVTWPALPLLALGWIVFLPNAPYLVTDLVHLREQVNLPNAIVLSLLAFTGLLIGVKSIQLVQGAVERLWGVAAGWRAVQVIAVLTAFGVYVGRVLRWNSWTILVHPHQLAHAVLRSPSEPGRVGLGLAGIVVFAAAFYISYRVLTGARAEAARLAPAPARAGAEN
jgi:uncharacterized membrane protein